jgi:hypothetical protein
MKMTATLVVFVFGLIVIGCTCIGADCSDDYVRFDFIMIDQTSGKDWVFELGTPISEIQFQSSEGALLPVQQNGNYLSVNLLTSVSTYSVTLDSRISNLKMNFNKVDDECCTTTILESVQSTDSTIESVDGTFKIGF